MANAVAVRARAVSADRRGPGLRLDDEQLTGAALVWDEKVVIHLQLLPCAGGEPALKMPNDRSRVARRYGPRPRPPLE